MHAIAMSIAIWRALVHRHLVPLKEAVRRGVVVVRPRRLEG
jgi:hypothetical protein